MNMVDVFTHLMTALSVSDWVFAGSLARSEAGRKQKQASTDTPQLPNGLESTQKHHFWPLVECPTTQKKKKKQ